MKHSKPSKAPTQQQSIEIRKQEVHVRPIPGPDDLQQYELIQPGFADRLIKMAEKEQDRRLAREDVLLELSRKSINQTRLGLWLGFASVIVLASLCGYLAYLGDTKAAAAVAAFMIGLAAVFVTRKFRKNDSQQEK